MNLARIRQYIFPVVAAASLAACNDGGSGGDGTATGTVSFAATDAPVHDVTRVKVSFDGIALQPRDGERITVDFDEPRVIENLLELDGTESQVILEDTDVPAGEYEWVRLFVVGDDPDSLVEEEGGGTFGLFIPGQQPPSQNPNRRFLQLSTPFTVSGGEDHDFTIDFELNKALVKPGGPPMVDAFYLLRPSLRLILAEDRGTIEGTVASTLLQDESCTNDLAADNGRGKGNAVYLFERGDALGDVFVNDEGESDHDAHDTDGVSPEDNPESVAKVKQNLDTGVYEYTMGFIEEGDYTIAFTCQALDDEPESDDDITFVQPTDISVTAGETTTHNFTATP